MQVLMLFLQGEGTVNPSMTTALMERNSALEGVEAEKEEIVARNTVAVAYGGKRIPPQTPDYVSHEVSNSWCRYSERVPRRQCVLLIKLASDTLVNPSVLPCPSIIPGSTEESPSRARRRSWSSPPPRLRRPRLTALRLRRN